MIGSLRGVVIDREQSLDRAASEVTIEVAGVGYRVTVAATTLGQLPNNETVLLHVHHHIREADQKLFGFLSTSERRAFEGLLSAHGVGPSLALAVLTTHPVNQLAQILADDDLTALCEVPGVGKKTAQRLLVELKSSLVLPVIDGDGAGAAIDLDGVQESGVSSLTDVREALVNLGYSADEVRRVVIELRDDDGDDDDPGKMLKSALLKLGTR